MKIIEQIKKSYYKYLSKTDKEPNCITLNPTDYKELREEIRASGLGSVFKCMGMDIKESWMFDRGNFLISKEDNMNYECTCDGTKPTICSYCEKRHRESNKWIYSYDTSHEMRKYLSSLKPDIELICKAFNYPSELLSSNLNPEYMTNQSLLKGIELEKEIREVKERISTFENTHGVECAAFNHGYGEIKVYKQFINFPSLKKQVLTSMKKRLNELEKDFAKL